jgi:hypothetical protein
VAAGDLEAEGLLVKPDGLLEIVHAHAGVEELFNHAADLGDAAEKINGPIGLGNAVNAP